MGNPIYNLFPYSLTFVGGYPTEKDRDIFKDLQEFPVFIDGDVETEDREEGESFHGYLKKINLYFKNNYSTMD